MSLGQIVDIVISEPGFFCACGAELKPGSTVGFWKSGIGRSRDKIVTCPSCQMPSTLLGERKWLLAQRKRLAALPPSPEIEATITRYDTVLEANWRKTNSVLLLLVEKLPRCIECQRTASYIVKNGPFYCDIHNKEHPNAQKVDWFDQMEELGIEE